MDPSGASAKLLPDAETGCSTVVTKDRRPPKFSQGFSPNLNDPRWSSFPVSGTSCNATVPFLFDGATDFSQMARRHLNAPAGILGPDPSIAKIHTSLQMWTADGHGSAGIARLLSVQALAASTILCLPEGDVFGLFSVQRPECGRRRRMPASLSSSEEYFKTPPDPTSAVRGGFSSPLINPGEIGMLN